MKRIIFAILTILILCDTCPVQAGTVWTEGHHEIFEGDVYGELDIYNDVTLDIFGGEITTLWTFDTTFTNWYDGEITHLRVRDDSIVNIFGGDLDYLWAAENSCVNLCAYDVVIMSSGGWYDQGYVTGIFYSNDESFYFDLSQQSYLHINTIPELTTLFLFGFGSLFLKRGRK